MRVDFEHLLDKEIRNFKNLDEVAELRYPTGCVDMTKREILAKLCEMEFLQNATWSTRSLRCASDTDTTDGTDFHR